VGTILDSRRCLFLATGEEKAGIVAKAIEGPVTSMISATALQFHPHCTVVLDEAAASRLKEADYYRWIYENEPQWKSFRDGVNGNGHGLNFFHGNGETAPVSGATAFQKK